jgi:hypothetical protein
VRGKGMLIGLELVLDKATGATTAPPGAIGKTFRLACRERGLILLPIHPGNVMLIAPPLNMPFSELDELVSLWIGARWAIPRATTEQDKHRCISSKEMPLPPTQVIGSYGTPGWLFVVREAMKRGEMGSIDIREAFDDATNLAIMEQEEAGVDVISDGEMRRFNFLVGFYDRITGLEKIPWSASLAIPART